MITIRHEHFWMTNPEQDDKLNAILMAINTLTEAQIMASEALGRLTDEVRSQRSVVESVKTLVTGLAEKIRENADDEDAMNSLADELDQNTAELAGLTVENTPAQPGSTQGGTGESASGTTEPAGGAAPAEATGPNEAKSE